MALLVTGEVVGSAGDTDPRLAIAIAREFLADLKKGKGRVGTPRYGRPAPRKARAGSDQ